MSAANRILLAIGLLAVFVAGRHSSDLEHEQWTPSCPPFDEAGTNATILADQKNCTRFFMCSNGRSFEFSCPEPLKFNDDLKVCDWPQNVNCEDDSHDAGSGFEELEEGVFFESNAV